MITKEQLDKYFVVRREADTLFGPIISEAWKLADKLLGPHVGFRLKIGPHVGAHGISFSYHNDYTRKSFSVETPLTIFTDETVLEERKKFINELIKGLR